MMMITDKVYRLESRMDKPWNGFPLARQPLTIRLNLAEDSLAAALKGGVEFTGTLDFHGTGPSGLIVLLGSIPIRAVPVTATEDEMQAPYDPLEEADPFS